MIHKLKVLSKEKHDGSLRLNESRVESAPLVEAKDMTILCLNENIKSSKTSKEVFKKQLLKKSDKKNELSTTMKSEIASGNNIKILSKVIQDNRTRLHELSKQSATIHGTENNNLVCSSQTNLKLTADVKHITTSKEISATQILQLSDEITAITVNGNNEKKL